MIKSILVLLISCTLLTIVSCSPNRVYEKHIKDFPSYRWDANRCIDFTFDIEDTASMYDIFFAFRHINGWQFKFINIKAIIKSPSDITYENSYSLKVMDNNGEYLSNCAGDLCDFEKIIERDFRFTETGIYTISFQQTMPIDPLPNIMEVGLIVKRSSK
ncbi:gliding motility lipoprotein GldH [Bacteroidota bacterium]